MDLRPNSIYQNSGKLYEFVDYNPSHVTLRSGWSTVVKVPTSEFISNYAYQYSTWLRK